MTKYPVHWTLRAKRDLRAIKRHIASDNSAAAKSFVRRIQERARNIGIMPTAAAIVPEASSASIREIFIGNYRLIYFIGENDVFILTVFHGAQLLQPERLDVSDLK